MSDDASPAYLASRDVDSELDADLARFRDIGRKSAEKGFLEHAATIKSGGQAQATGISEWVTNLPRNITVGVWDAAMNMLEFGGDFLAGEKPEGIRGTASNLGIEGGIQETPQQRREKWTAQPSSSPYEPLMEAGRQLRGEIALKSGTADEITQSAAQFFIPFMAFSKMVGGLKAGSTIARIGKAAAAETATMMTAFEPHSARFADLLRLADTNNGLVNHYIDYMAADADEGEWEGRFKNAADSLATSAAIAGVIKVGGVTLKAARHGRLSGPQKIAGDAGAETLDITPADTLSGADRELESVFGEQLNADLRRALRDYAKVPGSDGGRILNTDLARELSEDYRADRTRSAAVHEPASALVKTLYAQKLAEAPKAGQEPRVLFTGGGTGAGKTTALEALKGTAERAQIIYDTNLNNFASARQKIDQALEAGKKVSIAYVWRDPVESLKQGALPRAMRMGRTVPLTEHAKTHAGGATTIKALAAHYADDPRVSIHVIDNSRGKGRQRLGSIDDVREIKYNSVVGELHEVLEAEHEAGRISDAVYRATLGELEGVGGRASGLGRKSRTGDGRKPAPKDKGSARLASDGDA